MVADNKIELHIPSVMGFEKIAMECAASMAKKMGFTKDRTLPLTETDFLTLTLTKNV